MMIPARCVRFEDLDPELQKAMLQPADKNGLSLLKALALTFVLSGGFLVCWVYFLHWIQWYGFEKLPW